MDSIKLSLKLGNEFQKVLNTKNRIEKISSAGSVYLPNKDIDIFYEGIFLKSVTLFESFVEEFFVGLLYDRYKLNTRKKVQKTIFTERNLALNYLLNGKSYIDLLPFDKLAKITQTFFRPDNPFETIPKPSKVILEDIFIIRNAIAHSSFASDNKFNKFIDSKHSTLPSKQRSPSKFLQSLNTSSQTMLDIYIYELNYLAHTMTNFS